MPEAEPVMGDEAGDAATAEPDLEQIIKDLGLTPAQIAGRLEASRKWENLAKEKGPFIRELKDKARELDQLKQQSMSDMERAVAQARAEGEAEALKRAATKVAAAEIRAAAAGRLDDTKVAALLDGVDLGKFVDDNGDVDSARVASFIDGIAPAPTDQTITVPDLGQGARGTKTALNGDPLLRDLKSTLGIR